MNMPYFKPGLLHLIFENETGEQFIDVNGYPTLQLAEVAAEYYKRGRFRMSGSIVVGVYICQTIKPA